MLISASYAAVDNAMETISSIVSDRFQRDDMKNVIFWVKGGQTRMCMTDGANGNIVSVTEVYGNVEFEEGEDPSFEYFHQLRAKDILDVMGTYKGLKRTKVEGVEFELRQNQAIMRVSEIGADTDDNTGLFDQKSSFRVTKVPMRPAIERVISGVNLDVEGEVMEREDLCVYLNALLPTVSKESKENSMYIMFGDKYAYTTLPAYVAVVQNRLPDAFKGFKLQNAMANFIKGLVSNEATFSFSKTSIGPGVVSLTFRTSSSIAVIKCPDMTHNNFNIESYVELPGNGVVLDKLYLMDVLKRASLHDPNIYIDISIEKDEAGNPTGQGTMQIISKSMKQSVPVIMAKGAGDFSFSINYTTLLNIIFAHATFFSNSVYIYCGEAENSNNIVLACGDDSGLWNTKIAGVSKAKASFAWGE